VFDGIPKTDDVGANAKLMSQEFRVLDCPAQSSAGIGYGIIGNIDARHRRKRVVGYMKKKAMGATDFKQVFVTGIRNELP
jgi:hypothetical protein